MKNKRYPCVVSIAGTDPSGGAGIQADIKTISATGSYAASIITALVAQNTQGVQAIYPISADFIRQQMDSVFNDLHVDAIKIGMLNDQAVIEAVIEKLTALRFKKIVFDPVMVAKSGHALLDLKTILLLKGGLFPLVYLITPNLFEAEKILDCQIKTLDEMTAAAKKIGQQFHINVLIKGGHLQQSQASDILYIFQENACYWFSEKRIDTKNTHGTGCTLSSAIASYLAQGNSLYASVKQAKQYLTKALLSGCYFQLGHGCGPVDHFYFLEHTCHDI